MVIESEQIAVGEDVIQVPDSSVDGVVTADWRWQVVHVGPIDDRHHSHPRVAVGIPVGTELRQPLASEPGLLTELPDGGGLEVLVDVDESARKGPAATVRLVATLDEDHSNSSRVV